MDLIYYWKSSNNSQVILIFSNDTFIGFILANVYVSKMLMSIIGINRLKENSVSFWIKIKHQRSYRIIHNLVTAAILAIGRGPYILLRVLCSLDCIHDCSKCYCDCQAFDSYLLFSIIIPSFLNSFFPWICYLWFLLICNMTSIYDLQLHHSQITHWT